MRAKAKAEAHEAFTLTPLLIGGLPALLCMLRCWADGRVMWWWLLAGSCEHLTAGSQAAACSELICCWHASATPGPTPPRPLSCNGLPTLPLLSTPL